MRASGRANPGAWLALGVAGWASACSGEVSDQAFDRTAVADTIIMENAAPLNPRPAHLRPVAWYGDFLATGPASLNRVFAFTVGPDGSVFIYDYLAGLKLFGPDGDFVRTLAREGAGPTEVRYVDAIAVSEGGNVAALDLGNRRVLEIPANGEARAVRLPTGDVRYHEDALHYTATGQLRLGFYRPLPAEGIEPSRLAYLQIDSRGEFSDSVVLSGRYWEGCPTRSVHRHRRGFWEDQRAPYVPKVTWTIAPDGTLAIGCPETYEFDVVHPDGRVLRVRRSGAERLTLGRDERQFLAFVGIGRLPDHRPYYARLILPGDGRIWVWPNQPMEKWHPEGMPVSEAWMLGRTGAFDVFSPDGSWLGTVPLPPEIRYSGFPTERPVVIRGDTVWALTRDSLDVNYVTRYEVVWD